VINCLIELDRFRSDVIEPHVPTVGEAVVRWRSSAL
jgi:hypothetical protein